MGWFGNDLAANSASTEAIHNSAIETVEITPETAELVRIFQQRRSSGYRRITDERAFDTVRPMLCIETEEVIRMLTDYVVTDRECAEGMIDVINILQDDFRLMLGCCSNGQKVVNSIRKLKHKHKELNLQFVPPIKGDDHVFMEQVVALELRFICTKLKEAIITLDTIKENVDGDNHVLANAIESLMRYTLIALRLDADLQIEVRTKLQGYLPLQYNLQSFNLLEV